MPKKRFTLNTSQTELLVTPKAGSSASLSVKVAPPPSRCSSQTIASLFLPQRAHNPKRNTSDLASKISYMQNTATASCVRCEHPHPSHYHPQSSALTSPPVVSPPRIPPAAARAVLTSAARVTLLSHVRSHCSSTRNLPAASHLIRDRSRPSQRP